MTCSLTSKDITIVSGYIPPSGISPPNGQSAKPLDPVSTKSGEGHFLLSELGVSRQRDKRFRPPSLPLNVGGPSLSRPRKASRLTL
jgi:hypothetical protein